MNTTTRRALTLTLALAAIVAFLWQCTGAFDNTSEVEAVEVFGPWLGEEAEAFVDVLDDFTDDTGIDVNYTGSNDFDGDLRRRIGGGLRLPDIAVVPQPALVAELVTQGVLVPFSDETIDALLENFNSTPEELLIDGEVYISPYRNNVKSLVWYRPDVFDENGWEIPETLDELGDFADELAETDIAPWCFTMEAGAGTGWAATDWVEDLVLRRAGPDAYDEWSTGDRPFDDEAIREAFLEFDELVLAPGHLVGGTQRALSTDVSEASAPLFEAEPGCAMYKQGSFATVWFPGGTEVGPDGDVDFFVLPGVDADEPAPLVLGGDSLLQMSDRDEVDQLMTFLIGPGGARAWVDRGGYLSNRAEVDLDDYDDADRRFAELLQEDREVRFDASDLLLTDIRELLLDEITNFVAQANFLQVDDELDSLAERVDAAFAELRENEEFTGDG